MKLRLGQVGRVRVLQIPQPLNPSFLQMIFDCVLDFTFGLHRVKIVGDGRNQETAVWLCVQTIFCFVFFIEA